MTEPLRGQPTVTELVAKACEFASLPDVYLRVKQVLDNPASSHVDVADALGTDPAIAARLLRVSNSAFYGRPGTISAITQAVSLLGIQQVHDLVLAATVIHAFKDFPSKLIDQSAFWHTSLFAGSAAKLLAEECGILDSERLFVAGLLAQLGKLILFQQLPEQMREIRDIAKRDGRQPHALEQRRLGYDYAEVGAALFEKWRLPTELVAPIRHHTDPSLATDGLLEVAIVHVVVATAVAETQGSTLEQLITRLDGNALRVTKLSGDQLGNLRDKARALAEQIAPIVLNVAA